MGAIVNSITVIIMGYVGSRLNRGISERVSERVMQAIGLAVVSIGISGAIRGGNGLIMVLSMVIGTLIGEGLDIDRWIIRIVDQVEARFMNTDSEAGNEGTFKQGFITATMIFCVGSMVIVGSLESGLYGNHTTLYTKSIMDGITALMLASSLGAGVMFSSVPILILEGSLTLLASLLQPLLTDLVITEMISVGSIVLIALGFNLTGLTNFKIMNFSPSIFMPIILGAIPFLQ